MVAVVEIANLQRPCKKITVEYLAWFMENTLKLHISHVKLHGSVRHVSHKTSAYQ